MFDGWDIVPTRNSYRDVFGFMDREFAQAEEMLNRVFNTVRGINPLTVNAFREASTFPYYYGHQITVGPDGKPKVREFGNVKAGSSGLIEQSGVREPLVDSVVDEKNNSLTITAEMPGLTKENIKVHVSDKVIVIHGEKDDKRFHTELPIDIEIDNASSKASYSNGVLELKFKLKAPVKPKGKEIKIE